MKNFSQRRGCADKHHTSPSMFIDSTFTGGYFVSGAVIGPDFNPLTPLTPLVVSMRIIPCFLLTWSDTESSPLWASLCQGSSC